MTTTGTSTTAPTALEMREVSVPSALALEIEMSVGTGPGEIAAAMGRAFATLMRVVHSQGLMLAGPPRATYQSWGDAETHFGAEVPIVSAPKNLVEADVKVAQLPEQRAMRFTHHGSYQTIRNTYMRIDAWLREQGKIKTDADWSHFAPMWEEYVSDPATTPEQELVTYIYLPLR